MTAWLWVYKTQKEVKSMQNSQAVEKDVTFKSLGEKVVKSKVAAKKWLQ